MRKLSVLAVAALVAASLAACAAEPAPTASSPETTTAVPAATPAATTPESIETGPEVTGELATAPAGSALVEGACYYRMWLKRPGKPVSVVIASEIGCDHKHGAGVFGSVTAAGTADATVGKCKSKFDADYPGAPASGYIFGFTAFGDDTADQKIKKGETAYCAWLVMPHGPGTTDLNPIVGPLEGNL